MTEQSQQERLAALAARRKDGASGSTETPSAPAQPAASATLKPEAEPVRPIPRPKAPSTTRLATAGASLVSFAAMVVAMGPLTASAAEEALAEPVIEDPLPSEAAAPVAPQVVLEVIPNYVAPDGTPLTPEQLAALLDGAPEDQEGEADPLAPAADPVAPAAPATPARPATPAKPAAPAPAPVAAPAAPTPATAPPATASPATASPVTAPPATVPPTTAAPAPAPAPTPPPRSDASG